MKKMKFKNESFYFVTVFLGIVIFSSCNNVNPPPANNVTAIIGGKSVSFDASVSYHSGTTNGGNLYIIGNSDVGSIQFDAINPLPNYIGSYSLSYWTGAVYQEGTESPPESEYFTDSTHTGVLNITSYNPTYQIISGNFSFIALQNYPLNDSGKYSITVTNGTFFVQLN
jgi:Family of unknown function (DUF6252)